MWGAELEKSVLSCMSSHLRPSTRTHVQRRPVGGTPRGVDIVSAKFILRNEPLNCHLQEWRCLRQLYKGGDCRDAHYPRPGGVVGVSVPWGSSGAGLHVRLHGYKLQCLPKT